MKLKVTHLHEGVWMSGNGHRAYLRGEMPACLLSKAAIDASTPTIPHHIQRLRNTVLKGNYSWELMMFYKP